MVDSTYPFVLQGGDTTQRLNINEIYMGGEAAVTSPTVTKLARDGVVGATFTNAPCTNALMDGSGTAPGTLAKFGHIASTKPQRSATLHLLGLTFNAFGGIARWQARFGEEISVIGNTASLGEVSLSAALGGTPGAMSGHCIYEVA